MGDVKTILPSPCLPSLLKVRLSQNEKGECKQKPRVKIVKEREFKIRCQWCMTRKCTLCKSKFKSMKELNDHMMDDHKYKFLCKYHHCHKSFCSQTSADCHIRHHSPGHYQYEKCSKMYQKYTLEAYFNMLSEKGYQCTYPKCDRVYKSQVGYNQHFLTYMQPKDKVSCPVCDKSFYLKKYLDEHLKKAFR